VHFAALAGWRFPEHARLDWQIRRSTGIKINAKSQRAASDR
jgi:hypothetical protein